MPFLTPTISICGITFSLFCAILGSCYIKLLSPLSREVWFLKTSLGAFLLPSVQPRGKNMSSIQANGFSLSKAEHLPVALKKGFELFIVCIQLEKVICEQEKQFEVQIGLSQ